ncbi:MAG: Mobile element protein [Candidatus Ruthia sp. Asou_11_S2]|nr:Mobile element protein [Candidatus Ruthia sp. Asou_11_S2]
MAELKKSGLRCVQINQTTTLKEIRAKAIELANLKVSYPNLKEHLLQEKVRIKDIEIQQEEKAKQDTLEDLL